MITAYLKRDGDQQYIEFRDECGDIVDLTPVDDIIDQREEAMCNSSSKNKCNAHRCFGNDVGFKDGDLMIATQPSSAGDHSWMREPIRFVDACSEFVWYQWRVTEKSEWEDTGPMQRKDFDTRKFKYYCAEKCETPPCRFKPLCCPSLIERVFSKPKCYCCAGC